MNTHKKHHPLKFPFMNNIMDDIFHPDNPVCHIIPTSCKKEEDLFGRYRPQPKTCLDYNISQTDTKMDAGDTKIHCQQTIAEYFPGLSDPPPPPAPKIRKTKYFSGGLPKWIFVDEVWRRKQEELQKHFHEGFAKRIKGIKFMHRRIMMNIHRKVLALVGPAWYQELSPKQLATVDDLKNCILKDLAEDTIINTQENIANLGLVLRPNHRHIKKALKNCCKCPVEFLLLLYQLINPTRVRYSINDRLLLSAVVHLTMKDTLKELHIRIPSPPRPPKVKTESSKKKKKQEYDSPYLIPFTFVREPPKFTGKYHNKHVQHPQSPYFCYLEELRKMQKEAMLPEDKKALNIGTPTPGSNRTSIIEENQDQDQELEEELLLAQSIYEELVDFRPVPKLLKPSIYIPCDNFRNRQPPTPDETEEEMEDDSPCYYEDCCDVETEITEELSGTCDCPPRSTCPCSGPRVSCVDESTQCCKKSPVAKMEADIAKPKENTNICERPKSQVSCTCNTAKKLSIDEETNNDSPRNENKDNCESPKSQDTCTCRPTKRLTIDEETRTYNQDASVFTNTDFASTRSQCGTVRIPPKSLKSEEEEPEEENSCKHTEVLKLLDWYYEYKNRNLEDKKPCRCKKKYKEMIETPFCQCEKCREERKKKATIYSIMGMKETDCQQVIPIIDRVIQDKPCDCLKKYQERIKQFEKERDDEARRPCSCRKAAKEIVETPFCQCEKCQEDRRMKAAKYIISGIKETEEDKTIVIEGVSSGRPCTCIKHYEKRMDEYEDFQKRKELIYSLKHQDHKYVIGGVVNTAQGPVYVISGMRPPIDCACAKEARKEEAERRMAAIMPHAPRGRIPYQIAGVRETPAGNVYILDNAMAVEDCDCMAVYQKFREEHYTCIKMYEDYLAYMKDVYNEFMNDMLPPSSSRKSSMVSGSNRVDLDDNEEEKAEKESKQETIEGDKQEESVKESKQEGTIKESEVQSVLAPSEEKSEPCKPEPRLCPWCRQVCVPRIYPTVCCYCGKVDCKNCTCRQVIECIDCTCGPEEVEEEETKIKRFFIFKKILCKRKWQMSVIKKALQSMADDGFPLAKLPQCHKLPHFKLWMQMRCGKFWTQEDRYKYILKSKTLWRHCELCKVRRIPFPILPITLHEARQMNWFQADKVRKMVKDTTDTFYRDVQQKLVHFGREYFPSTFTYEFPFKTWRDCYFAYTPGKEEDVLIRFKWQKYEFKNYAEMQHICG